MKFPLTKPIAVEGEPVSVLDIREDVEAEDLLVMDGVEGENHKAVHLIAHLANVPPSSIKRMNARDFVRLNLLVRPFLQDGPSTGGTSAETSLSRSTSAPTKSSG